MSRLVVIALLVLAAVATADTFRPKAKSEASDAVSVAQGRVIHPRTSSGFEPAGALMRTRVLYSGREYLGPEEIRGALPPQLRNGPFDIAHLAVAPDGALVLAVLAFPPGGPPSDGIQIWRNRRLESSFLVPVGSFGGGIGFAAEGRLVAALSGDGSLVSLFRRNGRYAGRLSATSW